jgi:hypothetical protein
MDNPDKPRNKDAMKGVTRDIEELRKSNETDLLEMVLYEAVSPDHVGPNERLNHTLKWLAAHQIILNERLRKLTIAAWVFGISSVVSAAFQVISVLQN